jgi:hypothetical protein
MDNLNTFWSNNPGILLQPHQLKYFFPNASYTMVQNLNALVRMFMYLSIVLVLYSKNPQYLLLPLGTMLVTYLLFKLYPEKTELFYVKPNNTCDLSFNEKRAMVNRRKNFVSKKCVMPTVNNPFMNFNYISDNYHRPPACEAFLYNDPQSQEVKKVVEDKFNERLYRDVGDLYSKRNGQREFYSVPYNGIPDQTSFALWLFSPPGGGATCKEDGLKCAPYTGSML